jgi:(S)-mandelate dehydrogenase
MHPKLRRIVNADDAQRAARRLLPRAVYDFYAGGAEDEVSVAHNRAVFQRERLRPAVLSGVAEPTLHTRILGTPARLPLIVAPMGAVGFGRRTGDAELARAAGQAGIPYTLSTVATAGIETIAAACEGRKWFQLYPLRDRPRMWALVARAEAAGYEALVLTVDVPEGGKRERDLRNDFTMPFRFTPRNVADFASRPRWALDMAWHGTPRLANLACDSGTGASSPTSSVGAGFDAGFGWADVAELRRRWAGPLVLKGILREDDARRAQALGVQALVISNHGGRQLDGAAAPFEVLPSIRRAVGSAMELYIDGGIRRGTDILKALARGANAVMLGRPLLFGVCIAGEAGAGHVIGLLADELRRSMVLCGIQRTEALCEDILLTEHRDGAPAAAVVRPLEGSPACATATSASPTSLATHATRTPRATACNTPPSARWCPMCAEATDLPAGSGSATRQ